MVDFLFYGMSLVENFLEYFNVSDNASYARVVE